MIPAYAPYDPATQRDESRQPAVSQPDRSAHGAAAADRTNVQNRQRTGPTAKPAGGIAAASFPIRRVSRGTVLLTLNQLAVMAQNGIDIAEALDSVAYHCRNQRLAQSLRKIYECVSNGQPFSVAVSSYGIYFPCTLAPMLAAAEATGNVPGTLGNACDRLRGELQLRGTILGAIIYPAILIVASFVVMCALVLGVLPQFSKVFISLGQPVPVSTQMLLDLGDFCRAHWLSMLPVLISVGTSAILLRDHPLIRRPLNRFLMYWWPIRNAYRPLQAGRMYRMLASMVQGGVPLLQSVRLARHTTRDVYWRQLLDRIEDNLIDGSTASEVMAKADFIPPESTQMMATAERTGRVAEVLENIGEFYEEEAGRRIKRLVVAMEPAIILVMGVIVAGVVMSLLLPLLDVSSVK